MNRLKYIKPGEQFFIIFLLLMTMEYVIAYYTYQGSRFAWFVRTSIIIVFWFICIIPPFIKKRVKVNYTFFVSIVFIVCLIWSLIKVSMDGFQWGILDGTCMFAILGGVWLSRFSLDSIEKVLNIAGLIGIGRLLYILLAGKINWGSVFLRKLVWTDIFYWSCVYWAIVPCVLLAFIRKKNYWIAITYWICGVINELLFLKRYIIADSLILIVMIIFILYKRNVLSINTLCKIAGVIVLMVIAVFLLLSDQNILTAFNRVMSRFQGISLANLDRVRESRGFFEDAGFADILLGRGFWSAHSYLLGITPALHSGWSNFIFKGGILYFTVVLIPVVRAYRKVWHLRQYSEEAQFAIVFVIVMSVRLLLLNFFSFQPELLFLSWGCMTVMDRLK